MSFLRAALLIGAWLVALPAFALDPIFNEELARAAFLKTEHGRAIVREVIRDARGAPDRLNRQHYRSFLIALDYEQNRELADSLEDHLTNILMPIQQKRDANGGAVPSTAMAQKVEEDLVIKAAEREFQDPGLLDLAGIAQEPEIKTVTRAMRAAVLESIPAPRRARALAPARPATTAAPTDPAATVVPDRTTPGLPKETADLDLYANNPKIKSSMRLKFHIARDLFLRVHRYLRDTEHGALPAPEGYTPEQVRDYQRNFYFNVRRLVRMFDGYNDYARDEYVYEIFTNVKRPAFAALSMASKDELQRYMQGEISIDKLIEAQKKIALEKNLDIPDITWEAEKRILYTIERLKFLCGTVSNGEVIPGEIAETTRNLKRVQTQLAQFKEDVERLGAELKELKRASPRDPVKIDKAHQMLLARESQVILWEKQTRKLVNMYANFYMEVVQLRPRVDLFNSFREGLISKGGTAETYVGALDMPDAFVITKELDDHFKKFQDYAEGRVMSPPGDPGFEFPDISARVFPLLIKEELRVFRDRILHHNKEFANDMNRFSKGVDGRPISARRSMAELATFVVEVDAKIALVKKGIGIVGTVGAVGGTFHSQIYAFGGWCGSALEPVLHVFGM